MSELEITIDEDVQELIDHSFGLAEELLNEAGSYAPFGLTINEKDEVIPFTYEADEEAQIDVQQVIDELDAVLDKQLENKEIKAYAIGYDIQIEISQDGDLSSALLVDIVHDDDNQVPFYFFPYEMVDGKAEFKEGFGIEK